MSAVALVRNKAVADFEYGTRICNFEELADYLKLFNVEPQTNLLKVYTETYNEQVEMACEWANAYASVVSD